MPEVQEKSSSCEHSEIFKYNLHVIYDIDYYGLQYEISMKKLVLMGVVTVFVLF